MLKILDTQSVEPRKSVVGVGSGVRNKVMPIGKYEVDGNDSGSQSGDFDVTF